MNAKWIYIPKWIRLKCQKKYTAIAQNIHKQPCWFSWMLMMVILPSSINVKPIFDDLFVGIQMKSWCFSVSPLGKLKSIKTSFIFVKIVFYTTFTCSTRRLFYCILSKNYQRLIHYTWIYLIFEKIIDILRKHYWNMIHTIFLKISLNQFDLIECTKKLFDFSLLCRKVVMWSDSILFDENRNDSRRKVSLIQLKNWFGETEMMIL